jgi:hypothetical protein
MQALLVVGGFIRVLVSGKKLDETDSSPEEPTMAEETPSS